MNKKILLTLALCVSYLFSFAQIEVLEEQRSLITKITATWCPNCGNWGWTFMEGLVEDNMDKALMLGAHFSGTLESPEAIMIGQNFNVGGQPVFILNNNNVGANSSNYSNKRTEVADAVNSNFAQNPIANTGIEAMMSPDNEFVVRTNTRFFQAAEGDFYLGVYVLENNVEASQSGNASDNIHPNVMRKAFGEAFGTSIANGSISAGTEIQGTYTMPMNDDWNNSNIVIATIIWEKVGDSYEFVNAYSSSEFVPFTNTVEIDATAINFQLTPTIVKDQATLTFNLENSTTHASIQLFDANGRLVNRVFEGNLNQGNQQFEINNNNFSGLYFVHLQLDGQILTEQVIFE